MNYCHLHLMGSERSSILSSEMIDEKFPDGRTSKPTEKNESNLKKLLKLLVLVIHVIHHSDCSASHFKALSTQVALFVFSILILG